MTFMNQKHHKEKEKDKDQKDGEKDSKDEVHQEFGNERENVNQSIARHLMRDDYSVNSVPKDVQLKMGAFLTNLMCKNLKYKIG